MAQQRLSDSNIQTESYPKGSQTSYLAAYLAEKELQENEWIVLIKGGDLLLNCGLDFLGDDYDGYVGTHYLGVGKERQILPEAENQSIGTIDDFIKTHQENIISEPGFSGTAIRVKFLKKFFEFYGPNESHLLQFVEGLSRVQYLTSSIVFRRPLYRKTNIEEKEELRKRDLLETIKFNGKLIEKLDLIGDLTIQVKKMQDMIIHAYKNEAKEVEIKDQGEVMFDLGEY